MGRAPPPPGHGPPALRPAPRRASQSVTTMTNPQPRSPIPQRSRPSRDRKEADPPGFEQANYNPLADPVGLTARRQRDTRRPRHPTRPQKTKKPRRSPPGKEWVRCGVPLEPRHRKLHAAGGLVLRSGAGSPGRQDKSFRTCCKITSKRARVQISLLVKRQAATETQDPGEDRGVIKLPDTYKCRVTKSLSRPSKKRRPWKKTLCR
jgi:hypothetical protein